MSNPIGLIAAAGQLPVFTAKGIRAAGRDVCTCGFKGHADPVLRDMSLHFKSINLPRLGQIIRLFHRWRVNEAVMVGKIQKVRMYDPLLPLRYMPDWTTLSLWYGVLRNDRRTDHMLLAVADKLASEGIELIDSTRYIPEQLAEPGVMTRRSPTSNQMADVQFALPIVRKIGDVDIGQAVAVRDREIIAVEAIEGTDAMIQRAGQLCRGGNWTLLKVAKPHQDMRFDVPTVGPGTIDQMRRAKATCLAVQTGAVILLDKDRFIEAANQAGIAVVGVDVN